MRKFRSGPVQLQRLLVTDGDRVFVTLGLDEPVSVLDAATGEEIAVLQGHRKGRGVCAGRRRPVRPDWPAGCRTSVDRTRSAADVDYKTTKLIKAVDVQSGETLWRWPRKEATAEIMPRTLAVSDGGVFFQEAGETVCLDATTGEQVWQTAMADGGVDRRRVGGRFAVRHNARKQRQRRRRQVRRALHGLDLCHPGRSGRRRPVLRREYAAGLGSRIGRTAVAMPPRRPRSARRRRSTSWWSTAWSGPARV